MDECLDRIDSAEGALQSDSSLIQWVRLQRLADEVSIQLAVDDSTNIGISDRKTQYALKGFERQMKDWEKQKPKDITSCELDFSSRSARPIQVCPLTDIWQCR